MPCFIKSHRLGGLAGPFLSSTIITTRKFIYSLHSFFDVYVVVKYIVLWNELGLRQMYGLANKMQMLEMDV